jgi:iron(III) transport system substrate-binding protein
MAVALQEEGQRSPADLFWAQDAGALGAVAASGLFQPLPEKTVAQVPEKFRNGSGLWVATSARARVLAYAPSRVDAGDLPQSVFDLTDPKWKGRVGWAPGNGSFQLFVTAMRKSHGEQRTAKWLREMKANDPKVYPKNTPIIQALANGEIDLGIPNHYYLMRFKSKDPSFPVAQTFFQEEDPGNLVMVAGIGQLKRSNNGKAAAQFVDYLLSSKAQKYFTGDVFEYPMIKAIRPNGKLPSLAELEARAPKVRFDELGDLKGTLLLLQKVGLQ